MFYSADVAAYLTVSVLRLAAILLFVMDIVSELSERGVRFTLWLL